MVLAMLAPLHAVRPQLAAPGSNEAKLIKAASNRDFQVAQKLLEAKVDVNAVDERDLSPLHWAARTGNEKIAQLLLDRRANVNAVDLNRWTPLHWAAHGGNVDIVALLLEAGANVNAVDSEGLTPPLHLAAYKGSEDMVQLLLDGGANVNAVDRHGRTALETAQEMKRTGVANLLRRTPAPAKGLTRRQKAGGILATLTAVVVGTVGIKLRTYQRTKKILAKKYKLGNLTKLQDTIWLATLLASYRMPWRLHALVRNNPGSLESLVGKDPQALAELYYGHTPSQAELDTFIQTFFAGIE